MELTIVGCSGSVPGPDSPASSYLLTASDGTRDWRMLLDLGSGAFGALQRHIDPDTLDAVVLSHLHPDHCLDLTALKVWRSHGPGGSGADLPVYGPTGAAERMARANGVDKPSPMSGMTFRTLSDGQAFTLGPFGITPYRVRHPVTTFGLRVEADGAVFAYTGDTDTCPGLVPLMAGADLVLAEAAFVEGRDTARGLHLTGRRAAEAVVEAEERGPVGRLLLTHLPPWTPPEVVLGEAREIWDGPTEVVRPGETYRVEPTNGTRGAARVP
ncbi:MBL fold metallo-hydrolase [Ornithinimicrobium sufpigmenti]|uniref:MBL fold metallo-hydrolase n=1 Tax=Ornithinimicrobium sufpigmenti TaxID=2508882 RepID=UPI0010359665|nr:MULTISPECIES: MBL fold metallo-hydrolase [unclassified Ornithinimicrobium]